MVVIPMYCYWVEQYSTAQRVGPGAADPERALGITPQGCRVSCVGAQGWGVYDTAPGDVNRSGTLLNKCLPYRDTDRPSVNRTLYI